MLLHQFLVSTTEDVDDMVWRWSKTEEGGQFRKELSRKLRYSREPSVLALSIATIVALVLLDDDHSVDGGDPEPAPPDLESLENYFADPLGFQETHDTTALWQDVVEAFDDAVNVLGPQVAVPINILLKRTVSFEIGPPVCRELSRYFKGRFEGLDNVSRWMDCLCP